MVQRLWELQVATLQMLCIWEAWESTDRRLTRSGQEIETDTRDAQEQPGTYKFTQLLRDLLYHHYLI